MHCCFPGGTVSAPPLPKAVRETQKPGAPLTFRVGWSTLQRLRTPLSYLCGSGVAGPLLHRCLPTYPPPLRGVLCGAGCVLHVDGLWPLRQQPVYQLAVRRVPPRGLAPGPPVLSPGVTPEGHACRRLWLGPKTFSPVPQIKVAKFQVVAWLCQLLRVRSESCV